MMSMRRAAGQSLAVLALAAGVVSTAPTAASAAATATPSCTLTISLVASNQYQVTVGCINARSFGGFSLKGEDTFADDSLGTFIGTNVIVTGQLLNEDFGDSDEVYANVAVTDFFGKSFSVRTNTVRGSF